ncbi:MAG TPA: hypothetical protein VG319_08645 [Polyangia bacterium]|nr:hypothetical protein [Polyangia bacterium]
MNRSVKIAAPVTVAVLAFALGARAADTKPIVAKIEASDKAFLAAYENGDTKKMKSEIAKAVSLGEKNGLGSDPVMADTYVLAAILEVEGNENAKAGVRDFVKALKIRPDVAIPKGMATSSVKLALKQARAQLGESPKESPVTATAEEPAKPEPTKQEKTDKQKADEDAEAKLQKEQKEQKEKEQKDKQAREDAEAKQQKDKQAREDAERDEKKQKEAARAKEAESKDRGDNERLRKEKAESDKQTADLKVRVKELEKDKADHDKQLADAKTRAQQLEKDKADRDKQLADARAQGEKDREALEKVARDKQAAEAEVRIAENKRHERERLFAGPEMPEHPREALTCVVPDEAPLRTDLFVHCVARPNVKARSIVFYYRGAGARYYSVPMERTTKGWYAAIVPGARVTGKALQYYAEAFNDREVVVASNGKESSPNILTLRPGGPRG